MKYTQLPREEERYLIIRLHTQCKGSDGRGCQLLRGAPREAGRGGGSKAMCTAVRHRVCHGAGSRAAVLNSYRMCSFVKDLILEISKLDTAGQPF